MKYLGSKRAIAKTILPIMLTEAYLRGINTWVEPFVGGGNMIDKVPKRFNRIGGDLNPHVIKALTAIRDFPEKLPEYVGESEYNHIRKKKELSEIESWVCFVCAFGSKFKGPYARSKKEKNYALLGKKNALIQSKFLKGVQLIHCDYTYFDYLEDALIYCDPPYQGTCDYKGVEKFDHAKFWEWVRKMSKKNLVFVSEYSAPADFKTVIQIKKTVQIDKAKEAKSSIEKLFVHKSTDLAYKELDLLW